MTTSDKINRLRTKLAELKDAGEVTDYIFGMWAYALDNISISADKVEKSANCDAVPYVPAEIDYILEDLTEESRVLDIGCLGGYGLFDIAERRRSIGKAVPKLIGVDVDEASVITGIEMAKVWAENESVEFYKRSVENLLVVPDSADLVIARLVLPYVRLDNAMQEMARVLRNGGQMLLQYHSFAYYRDCFINKSGLKVKLYYLRAILSGCMLGLFGAQPNNRFFAETALNDRLLMRLAEKHGLAVEWLGGFKNKPIVLLSKAEG